MAKCPQCQAPVGVRAMLGQTGLAGITCRNCQASLEPTRWSYAAALGGAMLAGYGVSHLLRQAGVGSAWTLLGLMATMTAVWLALLRVLVRLRVKVTSVSSLRETR